MKTKTEIIEETAAFYNLGNRSAENSFCQYISPMGKCCAFSRCCKDDKKTFQSLRYADREIGSLSEGNGDFMLPLLKEEYQGHDWRFWRDIQNFHDDEENWDEEGLSLDGRTQKKTLLEKYED